MLMQIETGMKDHTMITYWGGKKDGKCVQITGNYPKETGYIVLTEKEAVALYEDLKRIWINK